MTIPSDTSAENTPSSSRMPSTTPAPISSARGAAAKFKPKGVRRSEAERARIAEEQLKIQEQRNAEEARRLARLNRGRGGKGRGRVGGGGSSGAGGYAFASGGLIKGEGDSKAYGGSGIIDNSRINADMLYNYVELSDEEDRTLVTSAARKKKPIMPMGIRRVEHKEEGPTMTTAAEIEAQEKAGGEEESDEEGLFVGGPVVVEDLSETPKSEAAEAAQRISIKKEEGDSMAMDLDAIPEGRIKTPESPELKKRQLGGEQKPKKKSAAPKDSEAEIIAEDLQRNLELFTIQDDTAEDGSANNAALEGHMFLFQFPPVLPPLRVVPNEGTSTNPIPIKPEPDDDAVMLNQPPVHIDLAQDEAKKVKKEGDEEENEGGDGEEEDELKDGGFIGNLIVRKSGRVQLSWGGQLLDLMPGTQTNFLSTTVLIEQADQKPGDQSQMAGVAYGMGKIQGSFALAPIWGDEEDWVVDPKELEIPGQ
ncbi:hypothetical protein N0V88_001058 [Collariella sp. IMI 366227]|nr:hypothetical protein N0V88_001058 [Collariella sp. IMI 366227]